MCIRDSFQSTLPRASEDLPGDLPMTSKLTPDTHFAQRHQVGLVSVSPARASACPSRATHRPHGHRVSL
eukprot:8418651-Karenia_brevis.AAC.1